MADEFNHVYPVTSRCHHKTMRISPPLSNPHRGGDVRFPRGSGRVMGILLVGLWVIHATLGDCVGRSCKRAEGCCLGHASGRHAAIWVMQKTACYCFGHAVDGMLQSGSCKGRHAAVWAADWIMQSGVLRFVICCVRYIENYLLSKLLSSWQLQTNKKCKPRKGHPVASRGGGYVGGCL